MLRGLLPHVLHSGGPVDIWKSGEMRLFRAPGVSGYTLEDEWRKEPTAMGPICRKEKDLNLTNLQKSYVAAVNLQGCIKLSNF